jgi:serine/threonine-protein kinase
VQGTKFGRYELVELIGRGGMGEVWRAHDTATDRVVALKVLPANLAHDEVFQERFRREAHAAARLNEPHVVPIHNYGEIDGRLYVDMRLIEGRDLQSLVGDGPLDPARAVVIIEQVAKALYAAHKVGLVHRDVKPSNVLVSEFDFAYLIDFGIARGADETGLTNTGGMIGTWHYMAPERLSSGYADPRSDIYSLACVLHECLTGDRPFPGDSLERQIAAHLMNPPPRPSIARRGVPAEFDNVIARGMAKDPGARYPTTIDLADAARAATTVPIRRPPAPPPEPATQPARAHIAPTQRRSPPIAPGPPPQPAAAAQYPEPERKSGTGRIFAFAFGAAAVLAGIIVATVLITQRTSGSSNSDAVAPTETPTTNIVTPTTTSETVSLTTGATTALPPPTSLNVSVPMSHPACDGQGIVVLANAVTPGSYPSEIQGYLNAYPGAEYLRTDEACPSLRQSLDGNPIYAVYRPAGRTQAEVCAAVRAAGGKAYGKWLDRTTDPSYIIPC